jgi:hypothetical protein
MCKPASEAWGSSRVVARESSVVRVLDCVSAVVKLAAQTGAIVVQIGNTAARLAQSWPEK